MIASTSFGMGVDCSDIRQVIHWGPPEDLDSYLQESGRAGRDGLGATACLLYGYAGKYVTEGMRNYGLNTSVCRRQVLYDKFLFCDAFVPIEKNVHVVIYAQLFVNVKNVINYEQLNEIK